MDIMKNLVFGKEVGKVGFYGRGKFKVEWTYNDHVVRCIWNTNDAADEDPVCSITVWYEGFDITEKFVETLNDVEEFKIRTTLDNLIIICKLIDENYEDFINQYNEENNNGDD